MYATVDAAIRSSGPQSGGRIDWFALALGVGALVALQRFRWEIVSVVGAAGALGLLHWLAGTWLA